MRDNSIIIDAKMAKENLNDAILRLERAILVTNMKIAAQEKLKTEIIRELDGYISSLEILLKQKE
jgi:hypothetical protein